MKFFICCKNVTSTIEEKKPHWCTLHTVRAGYMTDTRDFSITVTTIVLIYHNRLLYSLGTHITFHYKRTVTSDFCGNIRLVVYYTHNVGNEYQRRSQPNRGNKIRRPLSGDLLAIVSSLL